MPRDYIAWKDVDKLNKFEAMALVGIDFRAPLREVRRVQFGILSPDEIVSVLLKLIMFITRFHNSVNEIRRYQKSYAN